MANASIGGLVSGLDTATIISQLMQLEAQPQTRLRSRVSSEQTALTALQALNTKLSTLATKAAGLAKTAGWGVSTATTDNPKVSATAAAGATPASLTFQVEQTASRSQAVFAATASRTDVVATPGVDVTLTYTDGRAVTVNTGDGSLEDIAAAVNAATVNGEDAGFDAVLVRAGGNDDAPTYRLMVTTSSTGDATTFTVSDPSFLTSATVTNGRDAVITVDGLESRSATNTFTGLMPGLDVTLQPAVETRQDVTVTVGRDAAALADKVKGIVDALNAALTDIGTVTAAGANGAKAGLLAGNATLRQVRDQLLSSITGGVGGESLAAVGIEVDRYGKVELDAEKFAVAYAADPAKVEAMFVDTDPTAPTATNTDHGFATALEALAKRLSNSADGVVTGLVKGRQTSIDGLNDAIESWDARLDVRRRTLERTYGALEVALGKLQSQSTWLAGQISSLPQMSSGS
jgi:flagellar hook-associated protein 2